jgi:hypothetical protein
MQQQLYNTIFNKAESDWDTNSFLKNTIEDYPYFGLAHYFNLKNTLSTKDNYSDVAAKAVLFFDSPFLLQAQLHSKTGKIVTTNEENLAGNNNNETNEKNIVAEEPLIEAASFSTNDSKEIENEKVNVVSLAENALTKENKKVEGEELLFEPLFASDYFASQGIKLSEAILADDRLGKQLKSFTSWLRTMKKVHPDKLPMVNAIVEAKVQNEAAKSNIEEEVITEAMAEAFTSQGKEIRAIEVYEKLSLLNPTKSAYFAAKIDQLKK